MFGKRKLSRKQSNLAAALGENPNDKKLFKTLNVWFNERYGFTLSGARLQELVEKFNTEEPLKVGAWDDDRDVYICLRKEARRNSDSHFLYYLIGNVETGEWKSAPYLEQEDLSNFGVTSHQVNVIRYMLREEYFDEVMKPREFKGTPPNLEVLSVDGLEINPETIDTDLYAEPVAATVTESASLPEMEEPVVPTDSEDLDEVPVSDDYTQEELADVEAESPETPDLESVQEEEPLVEQEETVAETIHLSDSGFSLEESFPDSDD